MSDAGAKARAARAAPDRQLDDAAAVAAAAAATQADLFQEDALTPEQQADEHKRQIEELTRKSQEDSRRAADATRALESERKQREEAQKGAFSAQETALTSQIESHQKMIDQAKTALRQAREVGDFDAEEKALDMLTDAKANLVNLNNQKKYVEELKKQGPPPPAQPQQQQQTDYRGAHGYSKASEDWVSQHPDFDTDPDFKIAVLEAARKALQAYQPDSYGFFKYLDKAAEDYKGVTKPPANQQQRRGPAASSIAAGPSRSGQQRNNDNTPNPNAVAQKLGVTVQDLQDFAKIAKMDFNKYVAEQAQIIEEEGRGEATGLYRGEGR